MLHNTIFIFITFLLISCGGEPIKPGQHPLATSNVFRNIAPNITNQSNLPLHTEQESVKPSVASVSSGNFVKTPDQEAVPISIQSVKPDSIGPRYALVIGNGDYQDTDHLDKLNNPINDAEDVSKALNNLGFNVMTGKNLTQREMRDEIAEFGRNANNADAALFYFAGHGIQDKSQNYMMPVNVQASSLSQAVDQGVNVNSILEEMDNAKSKVNIVMLDACRNNPFTGKFRSGIMRGLAPIDAMPKGTVIIYATSPGDTASDGSNRNGLFTEGLLHGLNGKDLSLDGVLTVASEYVETKSQSEQSPYVNGPKTLQKRFSFAR